MKSDIEIEKFDIGITKLEIADLRLQALLKQENTAEIDNILRQIDGEFDRFSALEKAETAPEHAQLSELRYIKNELRRLLHKLESEVSDDKTTKYLHKLLAKLRG